MRAAPLALVVALAACGSEASPSPGLLRGTVPAGPFWVMTYNVNFERPSDATLDAIEEANPDLAFLQEVTPDFALKIHDRFDGAYATVWTSPADDEGGMAVLARYPLEERVHPPHEGQAFPSRCFTVQGTPLGDLDVLSVHLHPPLDEEGRLITGFFTTGELRRAELGHHLGCFEAPPDLVLGDFNEGEGAAISHLEALGMREAQRGFEPVERTWTWEDSWTDLQGRPDHIFAGPALRVVAVQVMETGGSDHRPLRAAFDPSAE